MKTYFMMLALVVAFAAPAVAKAEPVTLFNELEWNSAPVSPPLPDALETYLPATLLDFSVVQCAVDVVKGYSVAT